MCWYKTEGKTSHQVLIPYVFTFAFWCLITILYLILASISIAIAVFSKTSHLNNLARNLTQSLNTLSPTTNSPSNHHHHHHHHRSFLPGDSPLPSRKSESYADVEPGAHTISSMPRRRDLSIVPRNETLSRRSLAMRALAFRLLGYISIPTLCIVSMSSPFMHRFLPLDRFNKAPRRDRRSHLQGCANGHREHPRRALNLF